MVRVRETHYATGTVPVMPVPFGFVREYISLERKLAQVEQRLAELEAKEKVIVLKEITKEEAKKEIQRLFTSGRTLYYSDIVKELKIDLETVVELCNELQKSGEVEIDASVS